MHERGMADDELIDDHERDRFADVSASADRDGDGSTMDDRARSAMGRDATATASTIVASRRDDRVEAQHGLRPGAAGRAP